MQALEAMQRLVNIGRIFVEHHVGADLGIGLTEEEKRAEEEVTESCDKIEQMLSLALPLARFRCHVEVDAQSRGRGRIKDEFTICSHSIHGIFGGLIGLSGVRTDVRVTLWEQSVEKAEMVSGYQGPSKAPRYRRWLQEISDTYAPPPPAEPIN